MFERFTERARQIVVLAQEEARINECRYIGAEHILIGILREEEGTAARVLVHLGATLDKAREAVKELSQGPVPEEGDKQGQIPFTPRGKKVLELALREALSLGHNYIGTEHVLLGLLREGSNHGLEVLRKDFDLDPEQIRKEVIRMLSGSKAPQLTKGTPDSPLVGVETVAEQREREERERRIKLKKLWKSPEALDLISTAITLGRQYPDRPATIIANAAILIHS